MYSVCDDSGIMALVDPDAYESFVGEDWEYDDLLNHILQQMRLKRILIWGTGLEETWRVDVGFEVSSLVGINVITGVIDNVDGHFSLVSWNSLVAAASDQNITLPTRNDYSNTFKVPSGMYECRIIQMYDPEVLSGRTDGEDTERDFDFRVELTPCDSEVAPWTEIPWHF